MLSKVDTQWWSWPSGHVRSDQVRSGQVSVPVASPVDEGQDVQHGGDVGVVVAAGLLQVLQRLLTQRHRHLVPGEQDRDVNIWQWAAGYGKGRDGNRITEYEYEVEMEHV